MARPSIYTLELSNAILQRLAEGETLRSICADEGMPSRTTVMTWYVDNVDDFAARHDRARNIGLDSKGDELLEIADDGRNDWMERNGKDAPGWALNGEHVQRSRLRVDAIKWYLSKLAPKRFGDRQAIEHSGGLSLEELLAQSYKIPEEPAAGDDAAGYRGAIPA